ncbi:MAG: DoxX family membrane protein [Myxococcales bacterium]|nr:DoxX family membrane protein [Myxococcales bacterium]
MTARKVVRVIAAIAMMAVGVLHFTSPAGFVAIVPKALPAPLALVYISGAAEILGGAGLLVRRVRRAASIGLVALYVAVFPANINMALNDVQPEGVHLPKAALYARLPFQALFIVVALWVGREDRA